MQLAYSSPIFCSFALRGISLLRVADDGDSSSRICLRCSRFNSESSVNRPYDAWSAGSGFRLNQPLQLKR